MNEAARKAKNEYNKRWRRENKERVNFYQKVWRTSHPGKTAEYLERYWMKKFEKLQDEI